MPQLFPPGSNSLARAMLLGGAGAVPVFLGGALALYWSPLTTGVGVTVEQPVPFSHQHHVGDIGLDCRYCHTSVETSAFAGIPPTETCMTCHSQIWRDAPVLAPVRASWTGASAAAVDAGQRPAGLRLFQPQHPCRQGRRLRELPRPGR